MQLTSAHVIVENFRNSSCIDVQNNNDVLYISGHKWGRLKMVPVLRELTSDSLSRINAYNGKNSTKIKGGGGFK